MLWKWLYAAYKEIQGFYTFPSMLMVVAVGFYNLAIDHHALKKKKLKREAKLSRIIGIAYILGGIGLFVAIKIFQ
ncbi:CLC_0170 family protein [Thermotalea metallivorans]|uniref:Uncharacterized protein n=1 Tax=Thermotalea metallivorans TaxID=520762 RepID=A0A140L6L8_9FIRM|nr:CLC_0170 family protein [Thermotalea metallivorans]KXG76193.1 hypothetical protein AN619_11500 [Thermotalea metallivorans]